MKIQTVDSKRRLILTGAEPGESYAVKLTEEGHYELSKVVPAPRKKKPSKKQLNDLMASSALTPNKSWEELRNLTREP